MGYKATLACYDLAKPSPGLSWQRAGGAIVGTVFPRRLVGAIQGVVRPTHSR